MSADLGDDDIIPRTAVAFWQILPDSTRQYEWKKAISRVCDRNPEALSMR